MKESLEEEGVEKHQLKATLKSELEEIKTLSSKAEKVQKIHDDVAEIKASLASKHLSSSEKSSIRSKLEKIESSAEKYASASGLSEKSHLKEQMDNNLEEVKTQLNEANDLEESADDDNDFEEDKEEKEDKEESDF